jgi:hypothetical protein
MSNETGKPAAEQPLSEYEEFAVVARELHEDDSQEAFARLQTQLEAARVIKKST